MRAATETTIRERAYEIWEREGRPEGRAVAHWIQAETELGAKPKAGAKRSRAQPGSKAADATPVAGEGGASPRARKTRTKGRAARKRP
jgi:hypothetical protein